MSFNNQAEREAYGRSIAAEVWNAVGLYQDRAPRTRQSAMRVLGMSEIGGCREYIRASVAGDEKDPEGLVKWPAFVGTAVGDLVEAALRDLENGGWTTQDSFTVELPNGFKVPGHPDAWRPAGAHGPGDTVDLKTRDHLKQVKSEGPKFKELVQVSGYHIGLIAAGKLTEDANATLLYLDRSGVDKEFYAYTFTTQDARSYLDAAVERFDQIADAMAAGIEQSFLRDEPESWCWYVHCPFYSKCWAGYEPPAQITDERIIRAILDFDDSRKIIKDGYALQDNAREVLYPNQNDAVRGWVSKEDASKIRPGASAYTLDWKVNQKDGEFYDSIDLRAR